MDLAEERNFNTTSLIYSLAFQLILKDEALTVNGCKTHPHTHPHPHPHKQQNNLSFLPERTKIDKSEKLVCNRYIKKNYAIHLRTLKQTLDHVLILEKVHRAIEFNLEAWLQPYLEQKSTQLRTK